jgi:GT2 family glycosyltransferase
MEPSHRPLIQALANFNDTRIEVITLPPDQWWGVGGGRNLLTQNIPSPLTMVMDDDAYLTDTTIRPAIDLLRDYPELGAVSMPHFNLRGRMIDAGGKQFHISDGVMRLRIPELNPSAKWTEVNNLNGSAFLYRTELRSSFSWDDSLGYFEDYDKSLQILQLHKWKQGIVHEAKIVHDSSPSEQDLHYRRHRMNGFAIRRSYRMFRAKWRLRLELRSHFLYEMLLPTITLIQSDWLLSALRGLIDLRVRAKMRR